MQCILLSIIEVDVVAVDVRNDSRKTISFLVMLPQVDLEDLIIFIYYYYYYGMNWILIERLAVDVVDVGAVWSIFVRLKILFNDVFVLGAILNTHTHTHDTQDKRD